MSLLDVIANSNQSEASLKMYRNDFRLGDFGGILTENYHIKGGIREEKPPLDARHYVWRYNHRTDQERSTLQRFIQLVRQRQGLR